MSLPPSTCCTYMLTSSKAVATAGMPARSTAGRVEVSVRKLGFDRHLPSSAATAPLSGTRVLQSRSRVVGTERELAAKRTFDRARSDGPSLAPPFECRSHQGSSAGASGPHLRRLRVRR